MMLGKRFGVGSGFGFGALLTGVAFLAGMPIAGASWPLLLLRWQRRHGRRRHCLRRADAR